MNRDRKHVAVPVALIIGGAFVAGIAASLITVLQRCSDRILVLSLAGGCGVGHYMFSGGAFDRGVTLLIVICVVWWIAFLASLTLTITGVVKQHRTLGIIGAIATALLWVPSTFLCTRMFLGGN